ncbi:pirin family protein [Nocardioides sp.]|uniref:pirin family protein n=1 Tax=Nocardioides sp. TaxID=35761 RepID=UPI0031FE43F8|nr:yhhW 3 [Nocardioides sp.]
MTRAEGRDTRHAFSFGEHYDPEHVGFGPMVCHDEHSLGGGRGFPEHEHRDTEIVTWVLDGVLEHSHAVGSASHTGRLAPGFVQVLSAGSGVSHSEIAATGIGITRFVQVRLTPDETSTQPSYVVAPVHLETGAWTLVASGQDPAAPVRIGTSSASFWAVRLEAGATTSLPDAERQHLFVSRGALTRSSLAEPLSAGDAFLLTDHPGIEVTAAVPTELLLWTFTG